MVDRNKTRERLNKEIRYSLQKNGEIGKDKLKIGEKPFAVGEKIIFLKNTTFAKNGEIGFIKAIDQTEIIVKKENGETVRFDTKEYSRIDYGYTITVHKAQGKTVEDSIYIAEKTNANSFYVAITRGKEKVQIYTQDLQKLQEQIQKQQEAREVLQQTQKQEVKWDSQKAITSLLQYQQDQQQQVQILQQNQQQKQQEAAR